MEKSESGNDKKLARLSMAVPTGNTVGLRGMFESSSGNSGRAVAGSHRSLSPQSSGDSPSRPLSPSASVELARHPAKSLSPSGSSGSTGSKPVSPQFRPAAVSPAKGLSSSAPMGPGSLRDSPARTTSSPRMMYDNARPAPDAPWARPQHFGAPPGGFRLEVDTVRKTPLGAKPSPKAGSFILDPAAVKTLVPAAAQPAAQKPAIKAAVAAAASGKPNSEAFRDLQAFLGLASSGASSKETPSAASGSGPQPEPASRSARSGSASSELAFISSPAPSSSTPSATAQSSSASSATPASAASSATSSSPAVSTIAGLLRPPSLTTTGPPAPATAPEQSIASTTPTKATAAVVSGPVSPRKAGSAGGPPSVASLTLDTPARAWVDGDKSPRKLSPRPGSTSPRNPRKDSLSPSKDSDSANASSGTKSPRGTNTALSPATSGPAGVPTTPASASTSAATAASPASVTVVRSEPGGQSIGSPFFEPEAKYRINFEDLEIEDLISQGSAGEVYLGYWFGVPVAIKKLYQLPPEQRHLVAREYAMLRDVNHPNIVQFLGLCDHSTGIYLVTEYVQHGDLFDLLVFSEKKIGWKTKVKIALQIAQACTYLHSRQILHRDLKSQNVLIGENYTVKLCDLGLATVIAHKQRMTMCGTDEWMAPEIAVAESYGHKIDVFSFGIVLVELITARPPSKRRIDEMFAFNEKAFLKAVPDSCPEEFVALVLQCTKFNPSDRLEFKEVASKLRTLHNSLEDDP
eukprot:TRINITY_DN5774_c0_g1_i2.p1 TRINITY_DN5774_c0_g1~~TRINITY_DN5774_c0_g1_i2.p1  ORF type:complete len:747 (-),score=170.94 TRINITY_DN5774_c0_g1_i2:322-2562(-)